MLNLFSWISKKEDQVFQNWKYRILKHNFDRYVSNPIKILFTRSLPEDLVQFAQNLQMEVQVEEFISIRHKELLESDQELLLDDNYPNWIFTSQNAVKILHRWLPKLQGLQFRNCFAVGKQTAQRVAELGYMATVPQEQNAESLVKHLATIQPKGGFLYFCGNIRRNTLVDYFKEKRLQYKEVVVYETKLIQPNINTDDFDAICFCSPSAVKSFTNRYKLPPNTPCFAIGDTTALALVQHTDHLIVSETPTLKGILESCKNYFSNNI